MFRLGTLIERTGVRTLVWKFAIVVLIPIAIWIQDAVVYDYVSDAGADLAYDVRVNRFTGTTCLYFRDRPPPKLARVAC